MKKNDLHRHFYRFWWQYLFVFAMTAIAWVWAGKLITRAKENERVSVFIASSSYLDKTVIHNALFSRLGVLEVNVANYLSDDDTFSTLLSTRGLYQTDCLVVPADKISQTQVEKWFCPIEASLVRPYFAEDPTYLSYGTIDYGIYFSEKSVLFFNGESHNLGALNVDSALTDNALKAARILKDLDLNYE